MGIASTAFRRAQLCDLSLSLGEKAGCCARVGNEKPAHNREQNTGSALVRMNKYRARCRHAERDTYLDDKKELKGKDSKSAQLKYTFVKRGRMHTFQLAMPVLACVMP
jgi:hypothetical protein